MEHHAGLPRSLHPPDRDSRHLDRMHEIDIQQLVMRCIVAVVPETRGGRLVDARAGDDDGGRAAEMLWEDVEEPLELRPGCHVGGLEVDFRWGRVLREGLKPGGGVAVEGDVPDEDGVALSVEGFGEGEVDACLKGVNRVGKLGSGSERSGCVAALPYLSRRR
jgi:hypothetical protein